MNLPEFLTNQDGEVRLTGHRIGLFHVLRLYNEGYTPEMLTLEFDTLALPLIQDVVAFYLENKTQVDKYMVQYQEVLDRQMAVYQPGPGVLEIRRRLEALRRGEMS